jgi:UDP-N-acetylglucosamine diphosphorylase/glucosamine-1-phosphate N-acetyltransferase
MSAITFDHAGLREKLYPFAETRDVLDIRIGILTLREKWERLLRPERSASISLEPINMAANTLPSQQLADLILGGRFDREANSSQLKRIEYPWHIIELNDFAIREDYTLLIRNKVSEVIPETVQVSRSTRIFIEEGAELGHCVLNAEPGPIYIGKNAKVMEGAVIRGPFALCEGAVVKMGAKVYGATTVGPYSVIGGEVKNSVIFGYSNKAHDGYLGDAVIGEWCNLGAGTTNSNVSNTGGNVSVWNPHSNGYVVAGNKCGLFMGDYSRSAINTCFNTGTVVGVSCNVFGEGLSPKHIPDFSWGMKSPAKYDFDKAIRDIANWKKMKNQSISESEIQQLKIIFERS